MKSSCQAYSDWRNEITWEESHRSLPPLCLFPFFFTHWKICVFHVTILSIVDCNLIMDFDSLFFFFFFYYYPFDLILYAPFYLEFHVKRSLNTKWGARPRAQLLYFESHSKLIEGTRRRGGPRFPLSIPLDLLAIVPLCGFVGWETNIYIYIHIASAACGRCSKGLQLNWSPYTAYT